MLDVPVYNTNGEQVDSFAVDEQVLGGKVNVPLLKQAVVAYHAGRRRSAATTKSRGMVSGSSRKLFRQKGTGNARRGTIRTNILRGGGVAFGKKPRSFRKRLPRKMRRAAVASAILAKVLGEDLIIVDELKLESPRTKDMAKIVANLKINRSCLLTLAEQDTDTYLSARNLPDITVRAACDLNAYDIATRQKMLVTLEAMKALTAAAEGG